MKIPVASRGSAQFNLRLPGDLRDQLQARARRNGRSLNTEIVTILLEAIEPRNGDELRAIESKLDRVLALLEKK